MAQTNGTSTYNGLTVTVRKALAHGLTFQGAYTWSKTIDESGSGNDHDKLPERKQPKRGPWVGKFQCSAAGQRERLLQHSLPAYLSRLVLHGFWSVGSLCLREGPAVGHNDQRDLPAAGVAGNITTNGDWNADGTPYARPNRSGHPGPNIRIYWRTVPDRIVAASAFSVPTLGTDGNLGRMLSKAPGFERVDMSLTKVFAITERFS